MMYFKYEWHFIYMPNPMKQLLRRNALTCIQLENSFIHFKQEQKNINITFSSTNLQN